MVWSGLCSNLQCTSNLSPAMQKRSRNLCQRSGLAGRRCRASPYIWRQICKTLHRTRGLSYSPNTCRNVLWLQGGVRARVPKTEPGFPCSRRWLVIETPSYLPPLQWLAALLSICGAHRHKLRLFSHFEIYPWAISSAEPTGSGKQQTGIGDLTS